LDEHKQQTKNLITELTERIEVVEKRLNDQQDEQHSASIIETNEEITAEQTPPKKLWFRFW